MEGIFSFLKGNVGAILALLTLIVVFIRSVIAIPFVDLVELSEINNRFINKGLLCYIVILFFVSYSCLYVFYINRYLLFLILPIMIFCISSIIAIKQKKRIMNMEIAYEQKISRFYFSIVVIETFA